jgi:hypothetical protein
MLQFKNLNSSELSTELNIIKRDLSYEWINPETAQIVYDSILKSKQLPDYITVSVIDEIHKKRFIKKSRVADFVCSTFVDFKNSKKK